MRRIIFFFLIVFATSRLVAQVNFTVSVRMPIEKNILSKFAQQELAKKLTQLTILNEFGNADSASRFVIIPQVSILQSTVAPNPPAQQLVQLSIVVTVGDTNLPKTTVAQTEIKVKGVGESESAAIVNAIQQIDIRNASLKRFIGQAKAKLVVLHTEQAALSNNLNSE
ncbi:MAG: hypothetical protein ACRC9X_08740, partial [Bacteroidales bacterium]